jgi:Lon protease-like protein
MLEKNTEIPLFPLNTVLFPGMMLPLHIFEERYKAMIDECLAADNTFGVVLAKNKQAVAPNVMNIFTDDMFAVGTTAQITAVERLYDDRLNLITVGQERFQINNIRASSDDYLIGEVTPFPLSEFEDLETIDLLSQKLRPKVEEYIQHLATASGEDLSGAKLPNDPSSLAFLAGTAIQGPVTDKQYLLTASSLTELIFRTAIMLDRENKILVYMLRAYEVHQRVQQLDFVDYSLN